MTDVTTTIMEIQPSQVEIARSVSATEILIWRQTEIVIQDPENVCDACMRQRDSIASAVDRDGLETLQNSNVPNVSATIWELMPPEMEFVTRLRDNVHAIQTSWGRSVTSARLITGT